MTRRHKYKKRMVETPELDVTTFLNLMVVLIPFLLISDFGVERSDQRRRSSFQHT
jgi:biopolymer transport protein ExbD